MKALRTACLIAGLMSLAAPSLAGEMGMSAGRDLDELWSRVQAENDLAAEDAVLLLESRRIVLDEEGTVATRVHRVVWIGTSVGLHGYADLRVPWNTATSRLDVEILRTWRDGRWWPDPLAISETAVVPTLPYAVNRADDYTVMRETMLLHDGVELPCIMETAYTITEDGLPGADGVFVFPRRDRSALTELQVTAPEATALRHESLNGIPEPVATEQDGTVTLTWRVDGVPALSIPLTDCPAVYEPTVVWSTWPDWQALRDSWRGLFDEAAVLDGALADSLQVWTENEPSRWNRIRAVVDQVNRNVRGIHYDDGFWTFAPRPAVRTWDTAYGHPLDRAVLTAALLRGAGYEVTPILVGRGHSLVAPDLARLAGMGDLYLSIKGDPAGLYDPADGSLSGQAPLIGVPLWRTDRFVAPFLGNSPWPNRLEVSLTLEPGDDGQWRGMGHFYAAGIFCPQGDMAGLRDGARDYLSGAVDGVLEGASLSHANPEIFHQHQVVFGFGVEVEIPEPDVSGRTRLVVGMPGHGLASRVEGIHLYEVERKSPVMLAGPLEQSVKIRLQVADTAAADLPAPMSLVNEAGEFTVTATKKDGWITVARELKLTAGSYPAEMWPQLRALLLEDADHANGVILLD